VVSHARCEEACQNVVHGLDRLLVQAQHDDANLTLFGQVKDLAKVEVVGEDDQAVTPGQGSYLAVGQSPRPLATQATALKAQRLQVVRRFGEMFSSARKEMLMPAQGWRAARRLLRTAFVLGVLEGRPDIFERQPRVGLQDTLLV